jgi:hypothetical protein
VKIRREDRKGEEIHLARRGKVEREENSGCKRKGKWGGGRE